MLWTLHSFIFVKGMIWPTRAGVVLRSLIGAQTLVCKISPHRNRNRHRAHSFRGKPHPKHSLASLMMSLI